MEYYVNPNKAQPIKKFKQVIDNAPYFDIRSCYCLPEVIKKTSANPNGVYNTRNLRISSIVNNYRGGSIQFGNTYLGNYNGFNLDYSGRLEGMPGGSYKPFKNKF
jgi:hypothetical protein